MANKIFSLFSKNEDENNLQPSEANAALIHFMDQFPCAILLLDDKGNIQFANQPSAQLLGYSCDVLKTLNIEKLGLTYLEVEKMLTNASGQKTVQQLVTKEITGIYVNVGTTRLTGSAAVMMTLEEIPQYRQLLADKKFLKSIFDNYPFAVTVQTQEGACMLWNHKAEELFATKAANALGKNLAQVLPSELVQSLQVVDGEVQEKQQSRVGRHMSFKNTRGGDVVISVTKVPTFSEEGTLQSILTVYEDITDRKIQEQELLQTRNLLQAVIDHVPLGLYTRTIDGVMTFFNKQSQEVFNETEPKCSNSPHPKQDKDTVYKYALRERAIIKEGKLKDFPDEVYVDRDGNEKIIHMIKVPLKQAGPEPLVLSIAEDVTLKREQEREIFAANSFLSAIVDNAPIGLYARNRDGKMLLRNKMCETIFGSLASEFDERGALPHESQTQVESYLNREGSILETGKRVDIPAEIYRNAAGENRIVHLIKVPVPDVEGNPGFVITLAEDITEKKEQESKLVEARNFLQAILDNAPIAIYARGLDNKLFFINKKATELFPQEHEYVAQDDFYGQREEDIFKEGKIVEFPEEWYTTRAGRKILLHLIKAPVFDKEGKPFMVLSIAEDITEKKMQEQEIVTAKNFLQTVINNLPIALSVKKHSGEFILWNKKSEELFGVLAKSVIGQTNYRTDITKEQSEFLIAADKKVFESNKELNIPQELISTSDAGVKIMHTVKTPVFNADGAPDYLLTVSEDITSKTKMEKQIREASDKNSLLVENAREGILILEDYKIIYANRAVCKMLGYDSAEEIIRKPILNFVSEDHKLFAQDKYEAVLGELEGAAEPLDIHFVKKNGAEVESELAAMSSKYLGRRIVLAFVRDVTQANKALRDIKSEREKFRSAFEKSIVPAFILTYKGYINTMNQACRELFNFTENDKNFFRNVYMRPALSLHVRKELRQGNFAQMDYVFDFEKAQEKFPGRVHGEGKLNLVASFVPINKRDSKDGSVEADYLVFLQTQESGQPRPVLPLPTVERLVEEEPVTQAAAVAQPPAAPLIPAPPAIPAKPEEVAEAWQKLLPPAPPVVPEGNVVLPNTEPYVICSDRFKVVSCNELFCQLCQLKKEELYGQDLIKIFEQDSIPSVLADLKLLLTHKSVENRDYKINLASGLESIPVRVTAVKDSNGNYLFVFRNMAFHRQIMKILEERSAQLNALLEVTDGVVFTVEFEGRKFGRIEQANKFLSALAGYEHDQLITLQFKELFTEPGAKNTDRLDALLARAASDVVEHHRGGFVAELFTKKGERFEAEVTIAPLDLAGTNTVLVVVSDLTNKLARISHTSKEAQELRSVRQSMPGIYLKTDGEGRVLEVYSNLNYVTNSQAVEIFLDKLPGEYWPDDAAAKELYAIKEALSIHITTLFEFEQDFVGMRRWYEASVTPITGRSEVIIWVKDVTDKRIHEAQIRELYAISNAKNSTITDQVDNILDFGKKVFDAEVGVVTRFSGGNDEELSVVYATRNDFNIERYMMFPIEECLLDVRDDNVVVHTDFANSNCKRCIHKEKEFGSLIAAPLYVGGKVAGALLFASSKPRPYFVEGAEELIGIMSRIMSMRIELREAGKTISESAQSLTRTLEYVDLPAVVLDLTYRIKTVNQMFLEVTDRRLANVQYREFFSEFIHNDDSARRMFETAEKTSYGTAFQVKLDLLYAGGKFVETGWDVFVMKDVKGEPEGYALIGIKKA